MFELRSNMFILSAAKDRLNDRCGME